MWWKILDTILAKNGSPAYQRFSSAFNMAKSLSGNSAKTTNNTMNK